MEQEIEKIENAIQALADAFIALAEKFLNRIKRFCNGLVLIALKTMGHKSKQRLDMKVYQSFLRRKFALRLFILRLERRYHG